MPPHQFYFKRKVGLKANSGRDSDGKAMNPIGLTVENNFSVGYLGETVATFGANLRRLRKAAGIRAKDLAAKLPVSRSTVSGWENDKKGLPETPTLLKLAKALNVSVEALLEGVDEAYSAQQEARVDALLEDMRTGREATTQEMERLIAAGDPEAALSLGIDMIAKFEQIMAMRRAGSESREARLSPEAIAVARAFEDGSLTLRGLISVAIDFDRQKAGGAAAASGAPDATPGESSSRPQGPATDNSAPQHREKSPEPDDETA